MLACSDENREPLLERTPDENISRSVGRHFVEQLKKPFMIRTRQQAHGHPIKTTFVYKNCPSKPDLHPVECFEIYHTFENYKEDHGC